MKNKIGMQVFSAFVYRDLTCKSRYNPDEIVEIT